MVSLRLLSLVLDLLFSELGLRLGSLSAHVLVLRNLQEVHGLDRLRVRSISTAAVMHGLLLLPLLLVPGVGASAARWPTAEERRKASVFGTDVPAGEASLVLLFRLLCFKDISLNLRSIDYLWRGWKPGGGYGLRGWIDYLGHSFI